MCVYKTKWSNDAVNTLDNPTATVISIPFAAGDSNRSKTIIEDKGNTTFNIIICDAIHSVTGTGVNKQW